MLSRARPCSPLVAVLLVVLGLLCGGPATAAPGPGAGQRAVAVRAAEQPVARDADGQGAPGCGRGSPQDADHVPGTPARPGTSAELLPALYDAHTAPGACGADQAVPALGPGRAPPALDPPSPVDLSVLRV
ncbi:hypothetical protein [Streptomyces sp. NPDC047123]|uniref:hypothetical protein n=1 Tax=unclassified Streptomyces TaxID=2593676 RepID=UPI0033EF62FA